MRSVGITQALPPRSKRQAKRTLGQTQAMMAGAEDVATAASVQQAAAAAWVSLWGARKEVATLSALRSAWAVDVEAATARLRGGSGRAADVLAARMEALDLSNRLDDAAAAPDQPKVLSHRTYGVGLARHGG